MSESSTQVAMPVADRREQRRQAIVAHAERVFLDHGFAASTMLMVARQAGASKETLYRHFRSKEELFAEVIESRSRWLSDELDTDLTRDTDIRVVLRQFGRRLLSCMTSREVVLLFRVVIAEAQRTPDLGRAFLTHGPERTQARLASYLDTARHRGEFDGPDPSMAARLFLSAVLGNLPIVNLCRHEPLALSDAEIDVQVETVVAMFLAFYGRSDVSRRGV